MTALTTTAFNVLNNLAKTLAVEPRFATGSGDAASDVNGWLGSVLSDTNNSPQIVALRAQLTASLLSSVPLTEADLFAYYFALLTASPKTIWGANLLEWCRADLGSGSGTFPDQSGNGLGYTGTCGQTLSDATLNNLTTISTDGISQTMVSAINLPLPTVRPSAVLGVFKLGTVSAPNLFLDSTGANFLAMGANSTTQARFKNGATAQAFPSATAGGGFTYPGKWCMWHADWSASATDRRSAGQFQSVGTLLNNGVQSSGRVIGAASQQLQIFELIHLSAIPTARDIWLYEGYLDALTANGVLHP